MQGVFHVLAGISLGLFGGCIEPYVGMAWALAAFLLGVAVVTGLDLYLVSR